MIKSFNEMNAEQRLAYRVGYRAALDAHQRDLDRVAGELGRAVEALRLYADEDAWSMRNEDVAELGLEAGPWYFDPREHCDEVQPWKVARAVLAEQEKEPVEAPQSVYKPGGPLWLAEQEKEPRQP